MHSASEVFRNEASSWGRAQIAANAACLIVLRRVRLTHRGRHGAGPRTWSETGILTTEETVFSKNPLEDL